MPSGSKRRKAAAAAKKKKEQQQTPNGSEATSFNGGDDVQGQESDEVSSPASQDLIQSGGQSFSEGGANRESSPAGQVESENVIVEEGSVAEEVSVVKVDEGEGVVEITRELKSDEVEGGRGDLSVEVGKNSDSSSSSSSSDDEEVRIEKTEVVPELAEVQEVLEKVGNTEDPVVPAVVMEEVVENTEVPAVAAIVLEEVVENAEDPLVPAIALEEKVENAGDPVIPAVVLEEVVEYAEDSQVPAVILEEVVEFPEDSQVPAIVLEEAVETADDSKVPAVNLEQVVSVSEASPVEELNKDLDKPVLSGLAETKDNVLPVILPTAASHGETSNVDPRNVTGAEDDVLPPSDTPIAVTRNGAAHRPKDSEIQESSEHQTTLLQAPLSAQRTSWKGCCGLFEIFTGSR